MSRFIIVCFNTDDYVELETPFRREVCFDTVTEEEAKVIFKEHIGVCVDNKNAHYLCYDHDITDGILLGMLVDSYNPCGFLEGVSDGRS